MMEKNIIVTTGIYDLIKEQIRRKQVSKEQEERLNHELKHAQQVLRRDLPNDIVTVNRRVTIKDLQTQTESTYNFVSTGKERRKKGKYSIMSEMGIATVGYKQGETISWPFDEGTKEIQILKVEML
ncbi:GreA/GreB family elongation factor [Moheibacter stercoris]|uniref:Regulator of nucleoside diphosphate kinase n=1 Tax=Moheibacter stercoris TaxID=1628251 RepID=A0ABV2LXW3_9FLAO